MPQTTQYADIILAAIASPNFVRATLTGSPRLAKTTDLRRVTLRAISLHDRPHLQISRFTDRKDFTTNHLQSEASAALADILAIGFANVHLTTLTDEIDIRLTKQLELQVGEHPRETPALAAPQPHNRQKNLPLPEGRADRLLQLMGIMTADGRIRPTMAAKFTQINEFLKLLDPLISEISPTGKPLQILDCACGLSYLTIATHHYLNDVRKIPAVVMGVDINEELIRKSIAMTPHMTDLKFATGRIGELENLSPDIVLALHACDTATDDAIAQAIKSHAKILLAVPCCHKNLNSIHADVLAPLHRHGILHHRLADLATDAFRALILRLFGYRTDVIEFISPEHTPKNLMIRAIKTRVPSDKKLLEEYKRLKEFFSVTPYLENALAPLFPRE